MEITKERSVAIGTAAAVPLRRLGVLLQTAREHAGVSLADLADRSGGAYSLNDLVDIEAGEAAISDEQVSGLLELYQADPGDLLASRSTLIIDLHEGTVSAGPWSTNFSPSSNHPDDVLARYLALLYEMRNLPPGTPIPLRTFDVSVLSQALAMAPAAVEERLVVLMAPGDGRVDAIRALLSRRVLVPAAGLVVAATAAGVLLFVPSTDAPAGAEMGQAVGAAVADAQVTVSSMQIEAPPQVAPPGADEPEIGDALTVEAPVQVAPPGADEPEIGDALTIERSDVEAEDAQG